MTAAQRKQSIEPEETRRAWGPFSELRDMLSGDAVLLPFKDGQPDWEGTTRDSLEKISHYGDFTADDIPRLAILTDGFDRFIGKGADVSIVTLWQNGTPIVQQIDGEPCPIALDLIMEAIVDDMSLEDITGTPFAAPLPDPPKAANDNAPPKAEAAPAGLNIFDWTANRYVGDPDPVEYLVDGVIESGIPGMVAAMGEVGKSYSLLELSRRIAFGSPRYAPPIFGGQVVQEGTAVFITGEDDARAMHRRLAALDPEGARFAEKGDKLIVVPMPSAVGAIKPYWRHDRVKGPVETDDWMRFVDQLCGIPDLRYRRHRSAAAFRGRAFE